MNKLSFIIIILQLSIILSSKGQELEIADTIFRKGITIQYGYGRYSIRDEYISQNRYSGTFPEYNIKWINYHRNHGFELNFCYGQSSKIKNYNAPTNIQEYSVSGKHLYPIKNFNLASRQNYLFFGPSWDFHFHLRNQNMATSIFTKTASLASFISGGININYTLKITPKALMEVSSGTNIFSLVARLPDLDIEEAKYLKFLVFPYAINAYIDFSLIYRISYAFSVGVGYHLRTIRVHSTSYTEDYEGWYGIMAVNNNVFFNISWNIGNSK